MKWEKLSDINKSDLVVGNVCLASVLLPSDFRMLLLAVVDKDGDLMNPDSKVKLVGDALPDYIMFVEHPDNKLFKYFL